jgi:hypothetical protein
MAPLPKDAEARASAPIVRAIDAFAFRACGRDRQGKLTTPAICNWQREHWRSVLPQIALREILLRFPGVKRPQ